MGFAFRFFRIGTFLAVCVSFLFSEEVVAANGKLNRFRLDLNVGNSFQKFDGVSGADFQSIDRVSYSGAFFYRIKRKIDVGLQVNLIPSIVIDPFVFTDNTVGSYVAKFYQYEFLLGYVRSKIRVHALGGMESFSLKGSPTLTRGRDLKFYYGSQISYDVVARKAIRIPLYLRFLKKSRRLYEFTNFASDPDVKAGFEFVVGSGVDFEFK